MNKQNKLNGYYQKFLTHLKSIYLTKIIYVKLSIFFLIAFVVLTTCFALRDALLDYAKTNGVDNTKWILIPNFLEIELTFNPGIAFSGLSNNSSTLVYFVQSIPLIIGLTIFLFSKSYLIDIPICFLIFGGLSNVVDRSIVDATLNSNFSHTVVDYFRFSDAFFKNFAIFNLCDVYIILGVIWLVILLLISFIKDIKNDNDENKPIKDNIIIEKQNNYERK